VYAAGHEELLPEDGCVLLRVLYGRVLWRGQARHLRRLARFLEPTARRELAGGFFVLGRERQIADLPFGSAQGEKGRRYKGVQMPG